MPLMDIRFYPDPILRVPTQAITLFDEDLHSLIADMWETMYAKDGVGLAAPQVGVSLKLAVVAWEEYKLVLINPEIIESREPIVREEGCLSFPGIFEKVSRPQYITVRYLDETGKEHLLSAEGFLARAIAHETDHLNGKLLIDHISPLRRAFLKKRIQRNGWEEEQ